MDSEISEIDLEQNNHKQSPFVTSNVFKSSKVIPECKEVSSVKPSKSVAMKQKWDNFVGSSTLHGLQHVFTSRTLARRILWTLFLLAGIAWFSLQTSKLLKKYFSYPVATKVNLIYEDAPEFPAVTICNFNMFRKSVVMARGYDQVLKYFMKKTFGIDTSNDTVNLDEYNGLNVTELYLTAGHQIDDTLVSCFWNGGEMCDHRNFTAVLTSMGLCHTFNSGKDGQPVHKVRQAGASFGLHVILNVQQHDYYSVIGYLAGLKILIHHHDTPPMVDQLGFAVGPGMSTFAAIRKQRVLNLQKPYEDNCSNETVGNIPGYTKYTTSACMLTCQTKYVVEKCGCRDAAMPEINDAKVCGPREVADCLLKEKGNFHKLKGDDCDCPVPCDTISFQPVLSYAVFPSNDHIKRAAELNLGGAGHLSPEMIKVVHDYMSQNMLELHVYFQELNYQLVEQIPAYDSESLLGEIGGQVGLCVGASLLTVIEFLDVIFTIIGMRFGFG